MKTIATIFALTALFTTLPLLSGAEEEEAVFSQAELDQMLAPIALYPDALLAQILAASTYPLEVVEAARWLKNNPDLEGASAVEAVADKAWDPSVKALVAFPQVVARMDEDLQWTRRLGDAFLLQEEEVMESVQGLRQKAYAAGNLDSLEHLTVKREREIIVIEPADPKVIYVPYYRPTVVYGAWWWPHCPPVYWSPPTTYHSVYYSTGQTHLVWSSGIVLRSNFFYSTCDWRRRQIVVHHHHHHHHEASSTHQASPSDWSRYSSGERWRHEPAHRRGVTYRSEALNERYGRTAASTRTERAGNSDPSSAIRPAVSQSRWDRFSRESGSSETALSLQERRAAARERQIATTRRPEDRHDFAGSSRWNRNSATESPRNVTTPAPRTITTPSPRTITTGPGTPSRASRQVRSDAAASPRAHWRQQRSAEPSTPHSIGAMMGRSSAPSSPAAGRPQNRSSRSEVRPAASPNRPEQRPSRTEAPRAGAGSSPAATWRSSRSREARTR